MNGTPVLRSEKFSGSFDADLECCGVLGGILCAAVGLGTCDRGGTDEKRRKTVREFILRESDEDRPL